MTRKEQLKKMTLPELEAQKQFILNGRVSFEDQMYSAELDDEIRLRKAQEQEPDKHDESGQRIEKKPKTMENGAPLSCENLYYRFKSLEEKHNAMYVSHTSNLEALNTHVRELRVTIDNSKKAINSFNSLNGRIDVISETWNANAKIFSERLALTRKALEEQQKSIEYLKNLIAVRGDEIKDENSYLKRENEQLAKNLDVVFNNYRSQNEKSLKLEAAINELKQECGESSVKERAMRRVQIKEDVKKERKEARTLSDIYMSVESIENEIYSLKSKLKQAENNIFLVNAVSWVLLMCIAVKLL